VRGDREECMVLSTGGEDYSKNLKCLGEHQRNERHGHRLSFLEDEQHFY